MNDKGKRTDLWFFLLTLSVCAIRQEVKTADEARAALSPLKNASLEMLASSAQMAAAAELLGHVIPLAWVDQQVQARSRDHSLLFQSFPL